MHSILRFSLFEPEYGHETSVMCNGSLYISSAMTYSQGMMFKSLKRKALLCVHDMDSFCAGQDRGLASEFEMLASKSFGGAFHPAGGPGNPMKSMNKLNCKRIHSETGIMNLNGLVMWLP